jgi:hypothetical protein
VQYQEEKPHQAGEGQQEAHRAYANDYAHRHRGLYHRRALAVSGDQVAVYVPGGEWMRVTRKGRNASWKQRINNEDVLVLA